MDRIHQINRERLAWCCDQQGISPGMLADELGISAAGWSAFWSEERGLTFSQLRQIARFFGRGVLFFLEPGIPDSEKIRSPQFRTLAQQRPDLSTGMHKLIERAERQRDLFLSLIEDEEETAWNPFEAPTLPLDNTRLAADIARNWLGLSTDRNNFDSYRKAVESKGVLVFRTNGYAGDWQISKESAVAGFSLYSDRCPLIVVRKMKTDAPQAFTLMHELAHILLHRTSWIDATTDLSATQGLEQEANLFAGLVLVPDRFLAEIDDAQRPSETSLFHAWLQPQCQRWGVSTEVVLRRLVAAGRVAPEVFQAFRRWSAEAHGNNEDTRGSRMYRHREPKHLFGDPFVKTVLNSLSAQRITLAKASTYLDGLKIADVHRLERHYAGA
jgi:Zn-dependent peptidase ImmA (M78 family)